nr:gamma-glutamylcyclotransferase family protein [Ardenticatena sp.]
MYLFVYGTLLSDQPNHRRIRPFIDVEQTMSAVLPGAVLHDAGAYPMAVRGVGRVIGEVVWLRPECAHEALARLDEYEGVAEGLYTREHATVITPCCGPIVEAWVYWGNPRIAARYPRIPSGDWRQQRRQKRTR